MSTKSLLLFINGQRVQVPAAAPWIDQTLLQFIRSNRIGLHGTKYGCGEGGCGACTVMVSRYNDQTGTVENISVNACLTPLFVVDHCSIVTVEGIGSLKDGLHPIQERMVKLHGSQCGFCTPGFVMSMYALLRNNPHPTEEEIHEAVSGNLCRCTGYRPIYDVLKTFVDEGQQKSSLDRGGAGSCPCGKPSGGCCRSTAPSTNESSSTCSGGDCGSAGGCSQCPPSTDPSDSQGSPDPSSASAVIVETSHFGPQKFRRYDPSSEIIFPPELKRSKPESLTAHGEYARWFRPTTRAELLSLRRAHPDAKLVCGNTELHIEQKFRKINYPVLIVTSCVPELRHVSTIPNTDDRSAAIEFGASATWTDVQRTLRSMQSTLDDSQTSLRLTISAFLDQLRWFAGHQIRNVGTVAGNLVTASPISDINPVLWATAATVQVVGLSGDETHTVEHRSIPVSEFFTGYRRVDLRPGELVESVRIPFTETPFQYTRAFKQSRRREDDIAIVTCAFRVRLDPESGRILEACLAYGGMAPTTVSCPTASAQMIGRPWDTRLLSDAVHWIAQDLPLAPDAPGGMVEYRRLLARNLFFKYFWFVDQQFRADLGVGRGWRALTAAAVGAQPPPANAESMGLTSADVAQIVAPYRRPPHTSLQICPAQQDSSMAPVGHPVAHRASDVQNTGEAQYTGDIELPGGALHAGLVVAERGRGRLAGVDVSRALAMPGVHSWVDHRDVPGSNAIGPVYADELLFVRDEVTGFGQLIGVILAETERQATDASRCVVVSYADESVTEPASTSSASSTSSTSSPALTSGTGKEPILTIADAIRENSFFEFDRFLRRGDPAPVFQACSGARNKSDDVTSSAATPPTAAAATITAPQPPPALTEIDGEVFVGGQEHFYLEPHVSVATPGEHGEMSVVASSQSLTKLQSTIATVLRVSANRVVCRAKRLGGAFGGKESRSIWVACAAAVCARKTGRTVRVQLDRDLDMRVQGGRHPFYVRYRVAHDSDGRVVALDADVYNNAGWSYDLSMFVMERALMHMEGPYTFPNLHVRGHLCRTSLPTSTAFRGFGLPQSTLIVETIIDHVARSSGRPVNDVRRLQLCRVGDRGLTGLTVTQDTLTQMWDQILRDSDFDRRHREITEFNGSSRYRKRGIYALPTRYGIGFDFASMHQAGALVHQYLDGHILLTHGGIEMGQGLNTKMVQIAAQTLNVPVDSIYICEAATDKVHNTTASGASVQSDLNGPAVLDACRQLAERLAPYRAKMVGASLADIASAAYFDRVDLCAHGYYRSEDFGYDWATGAGQAVVYNSYGTAVVETEVDVLTGDVSIVRTDILMDIGRSLNPAIDVGQIEGAFVQGLGLYLMEELVWTKRGLFTQGPSTYKIPTMNDIPIDFRVRIFDYHPDQAAIHSSKGIGEPPLLLSAASFFAVKEAIYSARSDAGLSGFFPLESPATCERIALAANVSKSI